MDIIHLIATDWKTIAVVALIILKWIYNAWTDGVTFPQFIRALIGEIVQEAPNKLPALTPEQIKMLAKSPSVESESK